MKLFNELQNIPLLARFKFFRRLKRTASLLQMVTARFVVISITKIIRQRDSIPDHQPAIEN